MADLGDVVPLTVDIRDAAGVLANAGTVTLTVTQPDATAVTPDVTNPAPGRYQCDFLPTQAGRHLVRWVATGVNASAYTDSFDVRPPAPDYILSMAAAKKALNRDAADTSDDEEIRALVEAITRMIEDYRKEAVVRQPAVDVHHDVAGRSLLLRKAPVIAVTSIVSSTGYSWPSGDITVVDAEIGEVTSTGAPFTGDVTVTYVAGRAVMPANYIEAAKVILKHLWQTQQTPGMGGRVFGGAGDDISVGLAGLGFALPNRAAELLGGRGVVVA